MINLSSSTSVRTRNGNGNVGGTISDDDHHHHNITINDDNDCSESRKKKKREFSQASLYLQIVLNYIDKDHLVAFIMLVFLLTFYVLAIPFTQPRVVEFHSTTTTTNSMDPQQNRLFKQQQNFLHRGNDHQQWHNVISQLNTTLHHIVQDVAPFIVQKVSDFKRAREKLILIEEQQAEASLKESTNSDRTSIVVSAPSSPKSNDGADGGTDSAPSIVSLKKFQIILENEITQVQREKENAINSANVNSNPAFSNQFLIQQQQQKYWQQQQKYQAQIPESACEGFTGKMEQEIIVNSRNQPIRTRNVVMKNINQQMIENESPQEPISEHPGGPYTGPKDLDFEKLTSDVERAEYQQNFVKNAMVHSWKAYHDRAWGMDEYQPRTCSGKNWNEEQPYVGLALSMIDGLTTLHVMGLHTEVDEALEYIKKMNFKKQTTISTFETTIRVIGSLLSIYELRGEKEDWILRKAQSVADLLMFAFNTTTGLPHNTVDLFSRRHFAPDWSAGASVLSEFGTVQLELRTLSYHTKDPSYDIRATHIMDIVEVKAPRDFLCPVYMSIQSANWLTDHVTLGALGDSFYEYVVKQYLLTGRTEKRYQEMFRKIGDAVVDKLLFRSAINDWAYTAEWRRNEFFHKQDHLACFFGGSLALAANKLLDPENVHDDVKRKEKWMKAAADLTTTCYEIYHQQRSGVSPENVEFLSGGGDFINGPGYYILRPETMESLFYLWRFTKEQRFRDYGWNIFRAIDRWCKVKSGGYAGLKDVNVHRPIKDNLQQSFWLAETLKYSFLLFTDDGVIDLDHWVFNTEAHPLKIRKRDPMDIWREFEESNPEKIVNWDPPIVPGVSETLRTETENMKKRRLQGHYRTSAKDQYSEEMNDGAAGIPDDDGLPFDPNRGMRGVPLISRKNRVAWYGVQSARVLYQGPPVLQQQQQQQGNNFNPRNPMYGNNNNNHNNNNNNQNQYLLQQQQQQDGNDDNQQPTMPPLPNGGGMNHGSPVSPPINGHHVVEQRNNGDVSGLENNNNDQPTKSSFASKYRGAYRRAGDGKK